MVCRPTPEVECYASTNAYNNGGDDVRGALRIDHAASVQSYEEQNHAGSEESNANVVDPPDLLPFRLARLMPMMIPGWPEEEHQKDRSDRCNHETDIVGPPSACLRGGNQYPCAHRPEDRKRL